jgi:glyoxylase-like metal-dependent hydrolase (beta-lactamase superfamily II)
MTPKPFASTADTEQKRAVVETLAEGVYAYTAEGDPNVGAIFGEEAVLVFDARATPVLAQSWIDEIRRLTDRPIAYVLLSHYHAVRVLGASAYEAREVIASTRTQALIEERGQADWDSELGRFPRLFAAAETIPGLTYPSVTFEERATIDLGGRTVELSWVGRGHTAGDVVAWIPDCEVLFAGDLVESEAAPYMGDGSIQDWRGETLDRVAAFEATALVGGRGPVSRGEEVGRAIEDTRAFLTTTFDLTAEVQSSGGSIKQAFDAVHEALAPRYSGYPIFEHCMPFNVQRAWDESAGADLPIVWTAERDRAVWEALQA